MDGDLMWSWILGVFAGLLVGLVVASYINDGTWQREAIRHGAAHYDRDSGEFTWNESEAKR